MFCLETSCSSLINSKCVYYESITLPYTGILTNDSIQTSLQKIEEAIKDIILNGSGASAIWGSITGTVTNQTDLISYLSSNYTPQARILTINGVSQDLSANRTWNVGTVTSIDASGGLTGLSFTGGPITGSGTLTLQGTLGIANGGTGVTTIPALSVWVANTLDTIITIAPAAGQSIRINAGGTAWEAYTPGSGGISGLTTNRIPYATSSTTLGDDSGLVWDPTNNALTIGDARYFKIATNSMYAGNSAGNFTTTGNQNTSYGAFTLSSVTNGGLNTAIGYSALNANTGGDNNVAVGFGSLDSNTDGDSNVGVGVNTLTANTTGSTNTAIGASAGDNITTGSNNVIIGNNIDAQLATSDNQLSIQNIIFGTGNSGTGTTVSTGSIGIGTGSPDRRFHVEHETATTNTVTYVQRLTSTSSGTPANGIGVGVELEVETSAANNEVGATIEVVCTDVTSTSEDFDLVFKTMGAGATASEKLRITSDGRLFGTALHNNSGSITGTTNQYLASGTYTPSTTNVLNITSITTSALQFMRVGNVVTVSGSITVEATGAGTTQFRINAPIASAFTLVGHCAGIFSNGFATFGRIEADFTNDEPLFTYQAPGAASTVYLLHFSYLIL